MNFQSLIVTNVTGLSHGNYALRARELEVGTILEMVNRPNNPVDNKAIELLLDGEPIGWIPRSMEKAKDMLFKLNDMANLKCVITHHNPNAEWQNKLLVNIYIEVA